jgi:hypothetical protein
MPCTTNRENLRVLQRFSAALRGFLVAADEPRCARQAGTQAVLLAVVWLLGTAPAGAAEPVVLEEVVDSATHQRYLHTQPAAPLGWLVHELGPAPAHPRPGPPPGPAAVPRALERAAAPWNDDFLRTQVKIEAVFPDQPGGTVSLCSGTMVGVHTVLTAGHCIFSHTYGGWADQVWVYPAMAGYHLTPYGESSAASLESTTWWAEEHDHRGDVGIVRLQQDTGELTGWADLYWGYAQLSGTIFAAGYASEGEYDGQWLYTDSGQIEELSDYLICHDMNTLRGMSGGAGWPDEAGAARVTAVNSYCEQDGLCCMARYIDLIEQQRLDSEAQPGDDPPEHWGCELARYAAGDGCDCLCGVWDPDCEAADTPAAGCAGGERCIPPGVCACAPQCDGRECGPDGCGGVCGWCDGGVCQDGQCQCQPDCAGRECGPDGCGGSCGACGEGVDCVDGECDCAPQCAGRECGPDGCGGECGQCAAGEGCVDGSCTCLPQCTTAECGPDGCGGSCGSCAGDQECIDGQCVCTYNCIDRECGSDGCGGSCGTCAEGQVCQDGKCKGDSGGGCGCHADPTRGPVPPGPAALLLALSLALALTTARRRRHPDR